MVNDGYTLTRYLAEREERLRAALDARERARAAAPCAVPPRDERVAAAAAAATQLVEQRRRSGGRGGGRAAAAAAARGRVDAEDGLGEEGEEWQLLLQ